LSQDFLKDFQSTLLDGASRRGIPKKKKNTKLKKRKKRGRVVTSSKVQSLLTAHATSFGAA